MKYYIPGAYMCYTLRTTYMISTLSTHDKRPWYTKKHSTHLCCSLSLSTTFMVHTCAASIYDPEMSHAWSICYVSFLITIEAEQNWTHLHSIGHHSPCNASKLIFFQLLCISWMVRNSLMKVGASKEFKKTKRKKRRHKKQGGKRLMVSRGPRIGWHETFGSQMCL